MLFGTAWKSETEQIHFLLTFMLQVGLKCYQRVWSLKNEHVGKEPTRKKHVCSQM